MTVTKSLFIATAGVGAATGPTLMARKENAGNQTAGRM